MKRKSVLRTLFCISILGMVMFVSCMNPLDFDPEQALATVNVTGRLDFSDVTSAVMMLSNRTKTVDVTKVVITQEEVPETLIEFNGKPRRLSIKAQYLKPSDKEYTIELSYYDELKGEEGEKLAIISTPIPKETYWLYLYRSRTGQIILSHTFDENNADLADTGNPNLDREDEGEGSVPGIVPVEQRDRMSVLVFINMTRSQDIDYVEFNNISESAGITENSPDYRNYRMSKEPRHADQQSIALRQGSWRTYVAFTPPGHDQQIIGPKNAVVSILNTSMSVRTNFMYFYRTKTGNYNLSPIWPPYPDDSAEDNFDPEHFIGEDEGVLEVINKSETATIIRDIMINNVIYQNLIMLKDDVRRFVLPVGSINVAFLPVGGNAYGMILPRTIKAKQTTTISYYDSLARNDEIPPDPDGHGVSLISVTNQTNSVVQHVYVVDPDDPMGAKISVPSNSFTPARKINFNETGRVVVFGTDALELMDNKTYLIQIEMYGQNGIYYKEYYRVLRGLKASITIQESDLSVSKSYGSKVTINNSLPSSIGLVSITGMQIYNSGSPGQKTYYSSEEWSAKGSITNGKNAATYVISSPQMPIVSGAVYRADIFLSGNGRTAVVTKDFASDGKLYGDSPDTHTRSVTIDQNDVPAELIGTFTPVTGISGIPTEVTSTILKNTTDLVGPGIINLNSAIVAPVASETPKTAGATNTQIKWDVKTGSANQGYYKIENDLLQVTKAAAAGTTIQIEITATIINGKGTLASQQNYTQNFAITLKYSEVAPESKLATSLEAPVGLYTSDMTVFINQSVSLLGQVMISPADAAKDGKPITVSDLTFSITTGSTDTAELQGAPKNNCLNAKASGTVTVRATLPAEFCKNNTALTRDFTVTVQSAGVGGDIHRDVTGINFTPVTVISTVVPGTSTLVSGGFLNLNIADVAPSNASKKVITWSLVSGDTTYIDTAKLAQGILQVNKAPEVTTTTITKSVTIRATITGATGGGATDFAKDFTISLSFSAWSYSNKVTSITLISNTLYLYEQDIKSLLGMVKLNPVGAYYNGAPITTNDLVWEIGTKSQNGNLTISGSNVTGVSAGIVTVRARLDNSKNGGGSGAIYSDYIDITIWSVPQISQNAKAAFWFLFVAVNDGIVFVPTTENDFTNTERLSGVTNKTWATSDADFDKTNFLKRYPNAIIGGRMSSMGYTPGVIFEGQPRPMTYPDSGRYYVFFLKQEIGKSDMRVYGNGPATPAGNKLFLLDLEHKGPQIVLKNVTGSTSKTAMYTSKLTYDPSISGVIGESQCSINLKADTYYNNMGIPIGIYRFKYWNNTIKFMDPDDAAGDRTEFCN